MNRAIIKQKVDRAGWIEKTDRRRNKLILKKEREIFSF